MASKEADRVRRPGDNGHAGYVANGGSDCRFRTGRNRSQTLPYLRPFVPALRRGLHRPDFHLGRRQTDGAGIPPLTGRYGLFALGVLLDLRTLPRSHRDACRPLGRTQDDRRLYRPLVGDDRRGRLRRRSAVLVAHAVGAGGWRVGRVPRRWPRAARLDPSERARPGRDGICRRVVCWSRVWRSLTGLGDHRVRLAWWFLRLRRGGTGLFGDLAPDLSPP